MSTPSVARRVGSFSLGIFTKNLPAKVAALVLAVLVWFVVRRDLNESQVFTAEVVPQLAGDLMLVSQSHHTVKVEFEGPTSMIKDMPHDPELAAIVLPVTPEDLSGQLRARPIFTLENGRIRHNYGEKVRIVRVEEGPITLEVAVRGEEMKPLEEPILDGLPADWRARVEVLTPQVRLIGPRDELNRLAALAPSPIPVGRTLAGEEGNEVTITPTLRLRPEDAANLISLAPGEQMQVRIEFRRSQTPRLLTVPFFVLTREQNWPVTMVPSETDLVKKTETGGYSIQLTFKGLPAELDKVEQGIERKEIWAFVRATDFEPYVQKKAGESGSLKPYLRLPQELWGKVSFIPPDRSLVFMQILER